ncbi:SPW repeat domain-containing protein [Psychroflexus aestuariivivens]|uniref:SPW repeat domain-containing protein n=1 Tax=Psychroflexus aestuariivivens TaxID=1795040 RepID=UPI000FDA21A7|nr:SPW repeat protein [Psychroflexus aestuariivivens]
MWARIINTILGLWLMIAPSFFEYSSLAADNGHILGPVIITFSVIAFWEATRVLRKWNYPIAIWLIIAPWVLGYENNIAIISDIGVGVLVLLFASVKGKIEKNYGGGWSSLWKKNPKHLKQSE